NYTRTPLKPMAPTPTHQAGGGGRIRTYEGISQQIYSLPPLAAWVPLLKMSRVFWGGRRPVSMSSRTLFKCAPHHSGAAVDLSARASYALNRHARKYARKR